jgi:hypothetical protein
MQNKLKIAAYAGLISLLVVPPEIFLEHMLNEHPDTQWLFILLIITYMISVSSTVLLYYGFYVIGSALDVSAITASSFIIILLNFFWYIFQAFTIQEPVAAYSIVGGTVLVVFGISRIVFGYGIFKVRDSLGRLATSIAVLEIVIGLFLISVILYLVGFVLSLAAAVLQIMLLLRLSGSFNPAGSETPSTIPP